MPQISALSSSDPWNERNSTLEQERLYQRLILLHTLTDSWIKTLSPKEEPLHRVERMAKVTLNQNLWMFEKMRLDQIPLELEKLVGAQKIDEFLKELQETIWIIQASTLENAFTQGSSPDELKNVLQQASWAHGKSAAEALWGPEGRMPSSEAFLAFCESNFYGKSRFLLERTSSREISFLWKPSPLQDRSLSHFQSVAILCNLHEHWIQGYFYGISRNTRVIVDETLLNGSRHPRFTLLSTY